MFCPQRIVEVATDALQRESQRLDLEQSPRGIDALSEVALHPVLQAGFAAAGMTALAEQPYPAWDESAAEGRKSRVPRPQRRDRQRCDLVLLPSPKSRLLDPVAARIAAETEREEKAGTLFARTDSGPPAQPGADIGTPPEDAFWLEVKTVGQWCYTHSVPGPNRTYSSEMFAAAADLPKLAADPHIRQGGLLLVVFSADHQTADHDVALVVKRARESMTGILLRTAGFDIPDRIGNTWCNAALLAMMP